MGSSNTRGGATTGGSDRAIRPWLERAAFDIEPTVAAELRERWDGPCADAFEYLAERHPQALLALISSNELQPHDLTFAAEIAGRIAMPGDVRRALLPLLHHDHAVVREGAVYGLAAVIDDAVRRELVRLAREDPSDGVRTAATDRLARV